MPVLLLLALAATPEVQLEPAGPVALALGQTFRVRAASGPTTTLVVWESGGRFGIRAGSVHAARFDPANSLLLDPEGLLISAPLGSNPAVAWQNDLGVWVVVYEFESEVWLRLVRPDGTFHPSTLVPRRVGVGRAPGVASVTMGYVVSAEAVQPVLWRFALAVTQLDATALQVGPGPLVWSSTVGIAATQPNVTTVAWQAQQSTFRSDVSITATGGTTPALIASSQREVDGVAAVSGALLVSTRLTGDDAGVTAQLVLSPVAGQPRLFTLPLMDIPLTTSVTAGATGEAYVTTVQQSGAGLFWKYEDGGVFLLGPSTVSGANAAAVGYSALSGSMSAWSTFIDGVFARRGPLEGSSPAGSRQLSFARGGHVNANVASWAEGDVVTFQVMGGVPPVSNATNVVRQILRDGGLPAMRVFEHAVTRFDDVSVASAGAEYAVLSGMRLTVSGLSAQQLTPGLTYPRVTTDRSCQFLVTGARGETQDTWVFRSDGGVYSATQVWSSPVQGVRPRLVFDRAGSSGLLVVNPAEQLWGTRLTPDLVARDDGGFLITNSTAAYPEVVADEAGGFLVLSTDYDNVWVRRVVDAGLVDERMILTGFWDLGNVIEVPGGSLAMATSRTTGDVVAVTLSVDGGVVVARQQAVATGLPHTNHAAAALANDRVTFVFGRYDVDAGAPTTRFIQWPRGGPGATCRESWECRTTSCNGGFCALPLVDASVELEPDAGPDGGTDAGVATVDAGTPDASVGDAGVIVDAGTPDASVEDAGVMVDAGTPDASVEDAGAPDAGVTLDDAGVADGGAADAGALADAGVSTEHQYRAGCDCQQTGGAPVLMLSALLLWWRRRRGR